MVRGVKTRPPTLGELTRKVWSESIDDDVFGRAAELSYYFLLALFPLLIFLTSILGFLPGAREDLMSGMARVVPADALKLVRETLDDIVSHRSGSVLSLALVLSLWSASSGVGSLMQALNVAYETRETRPFWKKRLVAIGLTLTVAWLVTGGSVLIMIGHRLGGWLAGALDLSAALAAGSSILGYVIGAALLFAGVCAIYYFGPDVRHGSRPVKAGALFASIGVVIGSLLFSIYLRLAPSASATYGSLGAVVTLLLWLYLMGLMFLIGGEINSELRVKSDE
jgi:membrane protein